MKSIAILGSTGSIGRSALEVIRHLHDKFRVIGLSADSNIALLYRQMKEFKPEFVCVRNIEAANQFKSNLPSRIRLFIGEEGLNSLVQEKKIEQVLMSISGSAALLPLLKAIDSGKEIALANKEALVMAGNIIMHRAFRKKVRIIPIDSEQSAIWQCLEGKDLSNVKKIYLTASGGPLRKLNKKKFKGISVNKILNHPRWKMGKKISVDSASLMNKGLEILETIFLFGIPAEKIKILIHPEAVIHSMVEFVDGSVLAQLSETDMRIPIQYALTYPERIPNSLPSIDFYKLKGLHFEKADFGKFPCLRLAYKAACELGSTPAVLNASNEVCVEKFLRRELDFSYIPKIIERVLSRHKNTFKPDLEGILKADAWARRETENELR
ncbi:MAG: 1-deoxy-D-xylulose-5-phosphate reductoisomerase [Candidatus Omnitrophica bacterium]|nr:1-deoxy-D-xylulose-5-phosphate reductoisomerase [Candidatus Omnitrophota bacterium]